jgi:hypothetical protein
MSIKQYQDYNFINRQDHKKNTKMKNMAKENKGYVCE